MSNDSDRQARIDDWSRSHLELNGMPCRCHRFAEKRIARNASQQGTGAKVSAATEL